MERVQHKRILFLSNGHGEDAIAAVLLEELLSLQSQICALPLVGLGEAYRKQGIEVIGPRAEMPSGGFTRLGLKQFWKDVKAGLVGLTVAQISALRKAREFIDFVVCVGDIYPVLLGGWFLQRPMIFVATAKTEFISGHYELEYKLMRRYCQRVYARDQYTADAMVRHGVEADFAGNLMMDMLMQDGSVYPQTPTTPLICLLPGSRGDAYLNLGDLLACVDAIAQRDTQYEFAVPLASSLSFEQITSLISLEGYDNGRWYYKETGFDEQSAGIVGKIILGDQSEVVFLKGCFGGLLRACDLVIGLAGTANEQAAGLGKPVITFPGKGVQFTRKFALAQKKLLGDAVSLVDPSPISVAKQVEAILDDPNTYRRMATCGKKRMGSPGGAQRIAQYIREVSSNYNAISP
ncbi:MAG: lipid-A-disaccharide synthase-related protein [Limnochordia bacterium]|nr:lipid-A-disaccharide synthase-related protein [Limnochordia bacterium]